MEFKDILKDFLIEKGYTQTAFAALIGVKQSQVSEWLSGKAKPGYDMLRQITERTGVSAEYFLGLSDDE